MEAHWWNLLSRLSSTRRRPNYVKFRRGGFPSRAAPAVISQDMRGNQRKDAESFLVTGPNISSLLNTKTADAIRDEESTKPETQHDD